MPPIIVGAGPCSGSTPWHDYVVVGTILTAAIVMTSQAVNQLINQSINKYVINMKKNKILHRRSIGWGWDWGDQVHTVKELSN